MTLLLVIISLSCDMVAFQYPVPYGLLGLLGLTNELARSSRDRVVSFGELERAEPNRPTKTDYPEQGTVRTDLFPSHALHLGVYRGQAQGVRGQVLSTVQVA